MATIIPPMPVSTFAQKAQACAVFAIVYAVGFDYLSRRRIWYILLGPKLVRPIQGRAGRASLINSKTSPSRMRRFNLAAVQLAVLLLLAGNACAASVPDWVRATLESADRYDKNAPFVVLLDERVTTVKDNGKAETRSRYVVRILTQEGRLAARREIQYDSQTKISDLHAWHLRADQKVFELESDKVIEQSIPDDLYSEIRSKVVRFGEVDIGSVVAFEWVQKEKPLVNQDYHFFQTGSPVVTSRYQLNLPAGWRVESFVFNHRPIKPVVTANSYTWQLQDLSAIKQDIWTPEMTTLSPCVAVSYFPPGGAKKRTFSCWEDVSMWAEQLMRRQLRARRSSFRQRPKN